MSGRPRLVVSEFMAEEALAFLRARFDVRFDARLHEDREALLGEVPSCEALIVRNCTQVDAELLGRAPRLRVVGRLGVGLDNIDVAACRERAIEVIPATGANARAVAEYVLAMSLVLLRGAYQSSGEVAAGSWPRAALSAGREIGGKTLGLVGFGGIGQLAAQMAGAAGMRVVACDPALPAGAPAWRLAERCDLEGVLAQSDVVSLHVPLTPETRNLLDAGRLALMRPGSVLVNTSRGGIVDEAAVAAALRSGRLGGAALDVFAQEPLAAGSPLAGCPNLILTPHVAGVSAEANQRVSRLIAERVAERLAAPGVPQGVS